MWEGAVEYQLTCLGHRMQEKQRKQQLCVGSFTAVILVLYFIQAPLLLQGTELGLLSLFSEVGE